MGALTRSQIKAAREVAEKTPTIKKKIWTRLPDAPPRNGGRKSEREKKNSKPSKKPRSRNSKRLSMSRSMLRAQRPQNLKMMAKQTLLDKTNRLASVIVFISKILKL